MSNYILSKSRSGKNTLSRGGTEWDSRQSVVLQEVADDESSPEARYRFVQPVVNECSQRGE